MKRIRIALALLLAMGLAGCGMTPSSAPSRPISASSPSADISRAESVEIESLNDSGQLDELDEAALEELAPEDETSSGYEAQLLGKGSTKIGYVRSSEDGKFFLQAKQGLWKKKDVSYPLVGKSEDISLKLAKRLNHKVLVRGAVEGTTMTVKSVYWVPDLAVVMDLLRTGCVSGKVYSAKTLVSLGDASITLRSVESGRIYRAATKRSGKYRIGRLPAGDYTLEAALSSYAKGTLAKVTVVKRKNTPANVPLTPN